MINRATRGAVFSRTAITDLMGERLYGNRIQQGADTYPMGYFRPISSPRRHTFDGMIDLQTSTVDFFLYAKTETALESLVRTFETELDGLSGTFNGVNIYEIRITDSDGEEWSDDHEAHVGRIEATITIRR